MSEYESDDPFDPSNALTIQTITLMRIYDANMAILTHLNSDAAARLVQFHAMGGIMAPPPAFDPEVLGESQSPPTQE